MSKEYDEYLDRHIDAVKECYRMLTGKKLLNHDETKFGLDEYLAYDSYFYVSSKHDIGVKSNFDYAWLHHQNHNKHHWQYWVLINDKEKLEALDIPERYINEMVADWGSFALLKKDGEELRRWYYSHEDDMILSEHTRKKVDSKVEVLADLINERLGGSI